MAAGIPDSSFFQKHLCQEADLAIASSEAIADMLALRYGRAPTVIGNGADYEAFVTAADSCGPDPRIWAIPRPRVGYTGALKSAKWISI